MSVDWVSVRLSVIDCFYFKLGILKNKLKFTFKHCLRWTFILIYKTWSKVSIFVISFWLLLFDEFHINISWMWLHRLNNSLLLIIWIRSTGVDSFIAVLCNYIGHLSSNIFHNNNVNRWNNMYHHVLFVCSVYFIYIL